MTFKPAFALLPAMLLLAAPAQGELTADDLIGEDPIFWRLALETAKADPVKGCAQDWTDILDEKSHSTSSGKWQGKPAQIVTILERWTLVAKETDPACTIDGVQLTAGTESMERVDCTNAIYHDGQTMLGVGKPVCTIICGAGSGGSPPCE